MERIAYRWRLWIVLLLVASLGIQVGSAWFSEEFLAGWRLSRPHWEGRPAFTSSFDPQMNALISTLGGLFSLSAGGVLALFLFPRQIRSMEGYLRASPSRLVRLVMLGLLASILVFVISLSSIFTMATFPMVFFTAGLLFFASLMGYISLAYAIGRSLLTHARWSHLSPVYAFVLGVFLLYPLSVLPLLGLLFKIFYACTGAGVVIATRFGSDQLWNLEPLIMEEDQE